MCEAGGHSKIILDLHFLECSLTGTAGLEPSSWVIPPLGTDSDRPDHKTSDIGAGAGVI